MGFNRKHKLRRTSMTAVGDLRWRSDHKFSNFSKPHGYSDQIRISVGSLRQHVVYQKTRGYYIVHSRCVHDVLFLLGFPRRFVTVLILIIGPPSCRDSKSRGCPGTGAGEERQYEKVTSCRYKYYSNACASVACTN